MADGLNGESRKNDPASHKSSFYERLVEHVFISEVLQEVWFGFGRTMEVLRSEVDASGYDVVFECQGVLRHVQLKTSRRGSATARLPINVALTTKPSGCVIWLIRDEDLASRRVSLAYRFFGDAPGRPLPPLDDFPFARHTKGNSLGFKAIRPEIRVLPKRVFVQVASMAKLVELLFGPMSTAEE